MKAYNCASVVMLLALGCSAGDGSREGMGSEGSMDGFAGSGEDGFINGGSASDGSGGTRAGEPGSSGAGPEGSGNGADGDGTATDGSGPNGADGDAAGPGGDGSVPVDCTIAEPSETDADGDGLDDDVERSGWTVTIENGFGELEERRVRSNPELADSNGDGLCDREARQSFLDPDAEQGDTDGDGLSDIEERDRWASSPIDVDSDDDSAGDPRLFDGNEAWEQGTSPTLADSDGDGISDYKELVELGNTFHPLIANTPSVEMRIVGAPNVQLDVVDTESDTVATTLSTTLERGAESSYSTTDTDAHQVSAETSMKMKAEYGWGGGVSPTAKVSWEASFTAGYSYTNTHSTTEGSVESSREAYSEALNESRTEGREISGGTLEIAVELENVGDITFTLGDYEVSAFLVDPRDADGFLPLTSLSFSEQIGESGIGLGPGATAGPLVATGALSTEEAMLLLANPQNLRFAIANVALSYQNPDNGSNRGLLDFEYLRQETNAKTAFVQVDFGNGSVIRRRVATNVAREDGRIVGLGLADALAMLELDYGLEEQIVDDQSVAKLARMTDPNSGEVIESEHHKNSVWMVAGNTSVDFDNATNFEDIVLRGGDNIYVMYVRDEDSDFLFAREEYLYGTLDTVADFDGDGIDDGEEAKVGWHTFQVGDETFPPVVPYDDNNTQVFSDPTLTDRDNDGLTDPEERDAGTDPNYPDTDGDGYCDGPGSGTVFYACPSSFDPYPLDPSRGGNEVPVIGNGELSTTGLLATAVVDASDANGDLLEVIIDWGDGAVTTINAMGTNFDGFDDIRESHTYARPGQYDVTVTARDAAGATATMTLDTETATPRSGLLLEYRFTDAALVDGSGNGFDPISNGYFEDGTGCLSPGADRFGMAMAALSYWDPSDPAGDCWNRETYLQAPHLPIEDEFTMSLWVHSLADFGFLMGQDALQAPFDDTWAYFHYGRDEYKNGGDGYGETDRVNFILESRDPADAIVLTDPNDVGDAWTYYAVVVEQNGSSVTASLYRGVFGESDLVVVDSETKDGNFTNPSTSDPFFVGNVPIGATTLKGSLDDVHVFDRGLAEGQLLALFHDGE